jgi:hypothetical protein
MTIKQQGGIFGRNPSFNDVDANSLNVDGTITSDGLTVDGTTSLEDVTVSLDDTTSADSMPALTPSGSELAVKNTNNSADYTGIRLTTRTSAAGSWVIANEFAGSYKGDLVFHARDGASSSADKITFTNAGSIKINTSGQGIDFSATSGTGTSELFDDYEEGTYTVTLSDSSGNDASGSTAGIYTKIGRTVCVQFYIINVNTSGLTSGDAVRITLPFANNSGHYGSGAVKIKSSTFSVLPVVDLVPNASYFNLFEAASGGAGSSILVSDLTSGQADIFGNITYNV